MPTIDIYNVEGQISGSISLPEEYFASKINYPLMAQAAHIYRENHCQHTSHSKTRAEVSGGGRKPWRQKGTGRARQGSIRQPQWPGGGIAFGPRASKPRLKKLTKKMRQLARISALSLKAQQNQIFAIEDFDLEGAKTNQVAQTLSKLPLPSSTIILLGSPDPDLVLASRNIPRTTVRTIDDFCAHDILLYKSVLLTKKAINTLGQTKKSSKTIHQPATA